MLRRPSLALAVAAAAIMLPTLLLGTLITHSSPQNLTWAAQFAEQFRAGVLYPRWMPDSFDGLGGPAFYFYPPLPFWADALVSVITANLLSVPYRLAVTSALILFASGLAMHAWLKTQAVSDRAALWGAIAWMAGPYHLLDFYMRGAFAEFTAFVFLPLVLLAVRSPVWLAFAYAGLLLSHLPSALLVSVTILPLAVLARAPTPLELAKIVAGGALGIGLAALYLVPALTLQEWISADQLWKPAFYRAERWLVLTPSRWPEPYIMQAIAWFCAAYALAAAGVIVCARRFFWPVTALACLALVVGVVPWFWQLPELSKVQFPWRLLLVVEFAAITALCTVPRANLTRPKVYLFAVAFIALVPGVMIVGDDTVERARYGLTHGPLRQRDVKEYEPRGYPQPEGLSYADLALEPVQNVPLIACGESARMCNATPLPFGELAVETDGDRPTRVVLRRFFFPAWRLRPQGVIVPTPDFRLIQFTAAPGRQSYRLERASLPVEWWGWAISGVSLLVLLAWALLNRRAIKRP